MLLPYRAKNPPERFPYVTVGLIVVNTLIFLFTSENFLYIREEAVNAYALTHNNLSLFRMISAMFLHGSWEHLAGNMLALWLFGAAVEGRLGWWKYLLVYLACGLTGDLLHEVVFGLANPDMPSLGASGAIMGMAGAYFWMFPFSEIVVFYWWWWRLGVMEWQARWVVLLYVGTDVLSALVFRGGDGVGHMAHIGGFGMGVAAVLLLRAPRDSAEVSAVQAIRAEEKDYSLLSGNELATLLQRPTPDGKPDIPLLLAYCEKSLQTYNGRPDYMLTLLQQHQAALLTQAPPDRLAWIVLNLPAQVGTLPPVAYLRLASRLEGVSSNDYASQCYRRIYDVYPTAPETEMALFRLATLTERAFQNHVYAAATYNELLRLFPDGQTAFQARQALSRLQTLPR